MRLLIKIALATSILMMLSGCSGSPTSGDIRDAMQTALGVSGDTHITDLKVIGCQKANPSGYNCDFTFDISDSKSSSNFSVHTTLVYSSGKWSILDLASFEKSLMEQDAMHDLQGDGAP